MKNVEYCDSDIQEKYYFISYWSLSHKLLLQKFNMKIEIFE